MAASVPGVVGVAVEVVLGLDGCNSWVMELGVVCSVGIHDDRTDRAIAKEGRDTKCVMCLCFSESDHAQEQVLVIILSS